MSRWVKQHSVGYRKRKQLRFPLLFRVFFLWLDILSGVHLMLLLYRLGFLLRFVLFLWIVIGRVHRRL